MQPDGKKKLLIRGDFTPDSHTKRNPWLAFPATWQVKCKTNSGK
jgi:hypothetical protein